MLKLVDIENQIIKYGKNLGWNRFTSIQKKAIPVIMRKKHTLLVAPTGSGKTEAAVLPLFTLLREYKSNKKGVRALYITPLRALNRDIHRRIIKYAEDLGLTADIRHGDTSKSSRVKMVHSPPDILITTPETLAIILTSRKMRENLRSLEWVIIDELHELIGSERGAHLSLSLERIELIAEEKITRIALSATLGNLSEAGRFLVGLEKKVAIILDQSIRKYDIQLQYINGSFKDIAEFITDYTNKRLAKSKSAILFTNTRDEAEHLATLLKSISSKIPIDVHHGSLSKEIREDTEHNLKNGVGGMVVSTSSLELGLDIGEVDLVIQLGSSRQSIKLIQRIGRSRHQIGESAQGLIITHRLDDELEAISLINRIKTGSFETNRIQDCSLDVLAHHLVGLVIEYGQINIKDMLTTIRKAYPFRNIAIEDIELCIDLLLKQRILRYNGEIARKYGSNTYTFYYSNISTIPDIQQFDVINIVTNRNVGRLDQIFIGEYGEPERIFTLKGTSWKIVSIDEIKKEVNVEPIFNDNSTIPYWVGELIPVDLETSQIVGKIRRLIDLENFNVSFEQVKRIKKTKKILGHIPDEKTITLEQKKDANILVIHSCFGSKINQTLATLLSTIISSKNGYFVETTSDPYRIFLSSKSYLDLQTVYDFLKNEIDIKKVLSVAVIGTHPLNWKTWYVAKKFGIIGKDVQYDRRASRLIQERYKKTALYREVIRELLFDKYDVQNTEKIFEDIKNGKIKIFRKIVKEFTPLAIPILQQSSHFAALPISIDNTILELVKERLENKKQRLICISCGEWETVRKTVDLKNELSCKICKSRLITVTYANDNDLAKIIIKKKKNKKITSQEEIIFKRAWKTSSLIQNFGYKAILTLSGFGIGADTAARILRKFSGDDDIYKDIYKAEKNFIYTRNFWDS